jgi:hypothetical protein
MEYNGELSRRGNGHTKITLTQNKRLRRETQELLRTPRHRNISWLGKWPEKWLRDNIPELRVERR